MGAARRQPPGPPLGVNLSLASVSMHAIPPQHPTTPTPPHPRSTRQVPCKVVIRPTVDPPPQGTWLNLAEVQLYSGSGALIAGSQLTFALSSTGNFRDVNLEVG